VVLYLEMAHLKQRTVRSFNLTTSAAPGAISGGRRYIMETCHITYLDKATDKIKKEVLTANTPRRIHELIGHYLAKQFTGKITLLEYHYQRGGQ